MPPSPSRRGDAIRACAIVLAVLALGVGSARAQECPEPPPDRPEEMTPASGASNVTLDAIVRARYTAGYFAPTGPGGDPATLLRLGRCGRCGFSCTIDEATPVPGLIQVHGDELFYVPDALLETNVEYVVHAEGVDGDLDTTFCTGARLDGGPPVLGAIGREAPARVGPSCELPDGGYRVGIYFERATDDGPPGSIEYLLYLTRGVGVDAPRLVARARNYAASEITMSVLLDPELGTTPVCVQLAAIDGVGNVTMGEEPHCFDPVTRTWFYGGCAASPARAAHVPVAAALALSFLLFGRRRRHRHDPRDS